mgnify:CR=1 FL=1
MHISTLNFRGSSRLAVFVVMSVAEALFCVGVVEKPAMSRQCVCVRVCVCSRFMLRNSFWLHSKELDRELTQLRAR